MTGAPQDRRSFLKLAAVSLLAAGCQTSRDAPLATPSGVPTPSPFPSPSPSPSPSPVGPVPGPRYALLPGEALPKLKQVAADFVQALTTRAAGQRPEDALASALPLVAPGFRSDLALGVAAPLYAEAATIGEVVYPQLSGLIPNSAGARQAGIMAVVRQRLLAPGGATTEVVRVLDIRLSAGPDGWRVTELVGIGGEPVDRPPSLDPVAVAVLDDPRIELPDSCRWDIHAGRISLDVLGLLADTANVAPLSVSVLLSGHPVNVFGTDGVSNHTQGRAVDLWRAGGEAVVTSAAVAGPVRAVLDAAAADPRTRQTGSPIGSDLDGPGRRSFNDLVHQDHLHLAVSRPPAGG